MRQTPQEIERHLRDQLGFLSASARAYDEGHLSEATRLAQTMRVLVHDSVDPATRAITGPCLLRQIDWIEGMTFLDSGGEPHPGSYIASCTLVYSHLSGSSNKFFPHGPQFPTADGIPDDMTPLFRFHEARPVLIGGEYRPFDTWWTMPVIQDAERETYSRRDLVLWRANQDGGSHVDPKLRARYAKLSRLNAMQQFRGGSEGSEPVPMEDPVTPSIRQIAFELAVSLNGRLAQYRAERGLPDPAGPIR